MDLRKIGQVLTNIREYFFSSDMSDSKHTKIAQDRISSISTESKASSLKNVSSVPPQEQASFISSIGTLASSFFRWMRSPEQNVQKVGNQLTVLIDKINKFSPDQNIQDSDRKLIVNALEDAMAELKSYQEKMPPGETKTGINLDQNLETLKNRINEPTNIQSANSLVCELLDICHDQKIQYNIKHSEYLQNIPDIAKAYIDTSQAQKNQVPSPTELDTLKKAIVARTKYNILTGSLLDVQNSVEALENFMIALYCNKYKDNYNLLYEDINEQIINNDVINELKHQLKNFTLPEKALNAASIVGYLFNKDFTKEHENLYTQNNVLYDNEADLAYNFLNSLQEPEKKSN